MPPLDKLLAMFREDVASITREMADGTLGPRGFKVLMEETISEYHISAALVASGKTRLTDLDSATLARLEQTVDFHVGKAEAFAREVQQNGWKPAYESRAQLYTGGIKTSYGLGQAEIPVVGAINLPAQPGSGSPCMTNCHCAWERVDVEPELGHYDYFWRIDTGAENCSTCKERAGRWNPLQVRYGEIV